MNRKLKLLLVVVVFGVLVLVITQVTTTLPPNKYLDAENSVQKFQDVVSAANNQQPQQLQLLRDVAGISSSSLSCLGLGFEEDMDKLLSKYKQVFVIMPAKAAGTTFREFTKRCMASMKLNAFVDHAPQLRKFERDVDTAFRSELKMPTLISSHVDKARDLHEVLRSATDDTLIVYIHRQETNRLLSAIKHVITSRYCSLETKPAGIAMVGEKACNVEEGFLIETIRKRGVEIGMGNTRMLTCETFESIKDNCPNLVFMNYKQAGQLQKLLAKHHCPSVTKEVQVNVGSDKKMTISVVLEGGLGNNNNGTLVPLEEWLLFKAPVIEYSLELKSDVSCQATTRKIERELFACADQTLGISGLSHDGQTMDFPL